MGEFLPGTIQVDRHDRLARTLQHDLTNRITETGARRVLINISTLEIVDSFIRRMLGNSAAMSRMLDAQMSLMECELRWRLRSSNQACRWRV